MVEVSVSYLVVGIGVAVILVMGAFLIGLDLAGRARAAIDAFLSDPEVVPLQPALDSTHDAQN